MKEKVIFFWSQFRDYFRLPCILAHFCQLFLNKRSIRDISIAERRSESLFSTDCSSFPDQKLSLGEVPMWAGQYRKYPRKYGAQALKYPWICRRNVTFSGLGSAMADEDVELPIISGPLSKTYSFRESVLQWQARMLNCPCSRHIMVCTY